jgi:hypothetical protein
MMQRPTSTKPDALAGAPGFKDHDRKHRDFRPAAGAAQGPLALVLSRLERHKLRESGPGRWRACCAACGGSNPSMLSIGEADSGAVLLRCWQGCSVEAIAAALGLDLIDLCPPKPPRAGRGCGPMKRRHLLSAGQALDLLRDEAEFVGVAAACLARGVPLGAGDKDALLRSAARIASLRDEVRS